jgi:hypothetical protein
MDNLSTYLKDHLAGSVAALNMIDHLIDTYEEKPLAQFFRDLRGEIAADQADLQWLIEKLDKEHNAIRKAGAWVAEKLSRAKIHPGESPEGQMGLYLAFEGLVLGITGKLVLWRGLEAAVVGAPELRGLDYAELQVRAKEQRDRVEAKRLELAPSVFKPQTYYARFETLHLPDWAFFCPPKIRPKAAAPVPTAPPLAARCPTCRAFAAFCSGVVC